MKNKTEILKKISTAISKFESEELFNSSINLFNSLGYNTERQSRLESPTFAEFEQNYLENNDNIDIDKFKEKAKTDNWNNIEILFQITNSEMSNQLEKFNTGKFDNAEIYSYLFISIDLKEDNYSRTTLSDITRQINRVFSMPALLLFKNGNNLTLSIIKRRLNKKDASRDVLEKVTLIKDINIQNPHRAHIDILFDLSLKQLRKKHSVTNFVELQTAWQKTLDVSALSKKFYKELSNWYFWAIKHVTFPSESKYKEDANQQHKAQNIIRLLTRLLFVWFIKEKKLIPEKLFDLEYLQNNVLKKIEAEHLFIKAQEQTESIYYKAILQNLFFATLNCPIKSDNIDSRERSFRGDESYGKHHGVDYLMRYKKYFKDPDTFLKMVNEVVPFLNGGLFECLDDKENKIYIDGFSDNISKTEGKTNQLVVPDYLFFGKNESVDLSSDYGVKNKGTKEASVKGLINILKSYKFTIAENTPLEEDVALDPELLGKVFENLLASYNPETKTTARKQTGSFYTPREIVNYMVDESLIAHLKNSIQSSKSFQLLNKQEMLDSFLDLNDEITIKKGKLPHWSQENSWYFVTFRLADSIPKVKMEQLKNEREQWLKHHGNKNKKEFTKEESKEYYRLFSERVEKWLNAKYGNCVLKNENNAKIIGDALKFFNKKRYELDEWVVMPNHVHVLVKTLGKYKISDILHSWKSYTASKINKQSGESGQLWMHESYDHIVRNKKAFNAIKKYIRENPKKANIVSKASSFEDEKNSKQNALDKRTATQDALDTMLHKLLSYEEGNPFKNDKELSKKIILSLDSCKILDPACGSGAFPMGILQKMVHILGKVDPKNEHWQELQLDKAEKDSKGVFAIKDKEERKQLLDEINEAFDESINNPDYARKLFLIENCIYGVDIQPIAAQISKLRFFISLVVEQKVRQNKPNFGIRPLPNLETKFVTANTLIGIDKPDGIQKLFEEENIQKLETELKNIRHKIFSLKSSSRKKYWRNKDKEVREKLSKLIEEQLNAEMESYIKNNKKTREIEYYYDLIKRNGEKKNYLKEIEIRTAQLEKLRENFQSKNHKTAQQLASWDPYNPNGVSPFFDPEWMFDVKDGFDIVIGNPPYVQIQKFSGQQCQKDWQNQNYKTFAKTGDLYSLFYEKGNMVLRNGGILTFITSNKWMRANYGKATRKYFLENTNPLQLIDFGGYKVFESATVDTNILMFKCTSSVQLEKNACKQDACTTNACTIGKDFTQTTNIADYLNTNGVKLENLSEDSWIISSKKEYAIKKRIEEIGTPLKDWDVSINYGIKTGFNEAFIIDGAKKDELIKADPKSAEIIKPILRGRDIKRYKAEFADKWLIATFPALHLDIDNYPIVKEYLLSFTKKRLEQSGEKGSRKKTNNKWFEVQDTIAYYKEFEKEKIVYPNMTKYRPFVYDNQKYLTNQKCFVLTSATINLKGLLAILNSWVFDFAFKDHFPELLGGTRELSKVFFENIPIPKISPIQQIPFEIIVDCILFAKEHDLEIESNTFESVIDALVFNLYFPDHMKERGIDILQFVEKDCTESFQLLGVDFKKQDAFDTLSDTQKEQIITELHTRWSDPNSKIVKRMNSFSEKSPDILKVILES